MKIAVCFSGQLRGFDRCFRKIESHYIDAGDLEPTYFFYGPKSLDYEICDICPDIRYQYEEQTNVNVLNVDSHGYNLPIDQFNWQWYNSKKSLDLALDYGSDFDVYMRIRADLYPVGKSLFDWDEFKNNVLYIPEKLSWGGVCDRIGFGCKETMRIYANFYGSPQFKNTFGNSETRLASYLNVNGVELMKIPNTILDFCHKDDKGIIRYPGPEIEKKLIELDGEILKDSDFCEIYWR